jgi:hypothetical protein
LQLIPFSLLWNPVLLEKFLEGGPRNLLRVLDLIVKKSRFSIGNSSKLRVLYFLERKSDPDRKRP